MKKNEASQINRQQRFEQYIALLGQALDHPDRVESIRDYCTGLLLPIGRKSIEPIAAQTAPTRVQAKHQSLQQFITDSPWRDRPVLTVAYNYALPVLQRHGGIKATIVDDTGIPKKGSHSVGVARQYCGQLGKIANCQVSVSLSSANEHFSLPIAYDLYLPQAWAEDAERRQKVGVPADIRFRTKPEIALAQIRAAHRAGLELGVILADAAYGDVPDFRDSLAALDLLYCVGVREPTTVWPEGKEPLPPKPYSGRGPKPKLLRRDETRQPLSIKELVSSLPQKSFRKVTWREGARGKMSSRFAAVRVRTAHLDFQRTEARPEEWLLIEWPEGEAAPTRLWLSNLPPKTSLKKLVFYAKLRFRIEQDYEDLKQETGLGHYEGRKWRGFHHHATLCIAAYAFLMTERGLFSPAGTGNSSRFPQPEISGSEKPGRSSSPSRTTQSDFHRHNPERIDSGFGAPISTLPLLSANQRLQAKSIQAHWVIS